MSFAIVPYTGYSAIQQDGVDSLLYNQGGASFNMTSMTCTQGTGALTFTLNPCVLKFRSTTLTTGVPVERTLNTAASLVLPSGGTLGAVTTVQARIVVVALDNAGTVELAVVNIAGGNDLSETGVISTTAISAAATANNVFYSTSARTNVAYRVVGVVDAVNTAGAWGNPVLVQGAGGNALTAMSSLGYGQNWQSVTRVNGTTYYNTTGKSIQLSCYTNSGTAYNWNCTINGVLAISGGNSAGGYGGWSVTIPAGAAYVIAGSITPVSMEFR